ncbi:molybdopterin-dependent oxidoreductase [Methylobacterium sp. NEAU 140]|uniref:molybdopterin-dependent oxidoreductase n=1 Tax=Methylobacterium sp. NEAU 140 TaxID=3064945 RepID=UPI0027370F91|nr:molybdopterin-dependent oxidoreductase [Methylobacterium sp. NEAU 140]MDP4023984.1 molybdopterin-dependent oxidoreductase [Methylobacterium sp. NEAU 140]
MVAEVKQGYCTLCRSRCGSLNRIEDGRLVAVAPDPDHPTGAALCAKGRAAPELLGSPRRLTTPLRRTRPRGAPDPGWVEIGWDEAMAEIAGGLGTLRARHGAETVAFAVTTPSGTPMVDSFEWVERFVRVFGSPNLIYAVEICGWHKDYAHALTFGRGIGAPDYDRADTIVLWGHNPTRTWLAQATRVAEARRRGATVVVVDPKRGGSGETADLWLPIRPGADGALAMGAIRHLLIEGGYDAAFVRDWTDAPFLVDTGTGRLLRAAELWPGAEGFVVLDAAGVPRARDTRRAPSGEACRLDARLDLVDAAGRARACASVLHLLAREAAPYDRDRVAALTRLAPAAIDRFHALFAGAPRLAYHAWTGVGQHTNATLTERAIATLYALTGAVDRAGGNLWTTAPPTRTVNGYDLLSPAQQRKALGLDALPLGPPSRGWITARDFARAALDGAPYRVRGLMSFGTNFVVSQGGSARNRAALAALEFHAHVDVFLNPTADNADIVLPASLPWEREALKAGFEITQEAVELIQLRQRMVPPLAGTRADYAIALDLACRLGHAEAFFGGSIEAGWDHQLAPVGLTVADLRAAPGGIRVPQSTGERKYGAVATDGTVAGFQTATRRVALYSEDLLAHGHPPLAGYVAPAGLSEAEAMGLPLVMSTAKTGWYVHSAYRHVASLRKRASAPTVEIAAADAAARGIVDGDAVVVRTAHGQAHLRARIDPALPEGTVIAEFGWWEDCPPLGREGSPATGAATANINAALSDQDRDPVSGSVPLRAVACEVVRDAAANRGRWEGRRLFRVASVRREGTDIAALTLAPADDGPLPGFRAGQHAVVHAPAIGLGRAYSLTGDPVDPVSYEIGVKHLAAGPDGRAAGRMSSHVHGLGPGDPVWLEPPSGTFTPPLSGARPVVLIAAGVGLTPFVGYLAALARCPETAPEVHLVAISRNGVEQAYGDRLRAAAAALPGLRITRVFTQPRPEDRLGRDFETAGRPAVSDLDLPPARSRPLAYLCGPDAFLSAMTEGLAAHGIPRFDIFSESFATAVAVPPDLAPRTVRLARSGASFTWTPAAGSLLDAADAAGLRLPAGCRAGQCESCCLPVASGTVAHLGPYDGGPEHCLTCRAVPVSDLVLDA